MKQLSNVMYRAEKEYKNARAGVGCLIREIVSNAIHAVIIRQKTGHQSNYVPEVKISIAKEEHRIRLTLTDNGEGFTEHNRKLFTHLDLKNNEKEKFNLFPKGQGRLAIVYFADNANYQSIYKDESGNFKRIFFDYPCDNTSLFFSIEDEGEPSRTQETGTILTLVLKKQTIDRAETFFAKNNELDKLKNWHIETFFPFFMENPELKLSLEFNGLESTISKKVIQSNIDHLSFTVAITNEPKDYQFKIWLVKREKSSRKQGSIICFARHLKAKLKEGNIDYEVDLLNDYDLFLTSEYFDNNVSQRGDSIEISIDAVDQIQMALSEILDKHFIKEIENNRKETRKNISLIKKKYPSLAKFVNDGELEKAKKILTESDIVNGVVEAKGKIEISYWNEENISQNEIDKLLNSSIHIYINHRHRILGVFQDLIKKFTDSGAKKTELEETVHDLFLKRGESLREANTVNHLHNLWILDDKYTAFSKLNALSTRRGQKLSDIYLWADDPDPSKIHELLILELKSPSGAHNAGDRQESMIGQIKRYATQFYKDPQKEINWNVNVDNVLYFGVVLASKIDINREFNSNNIGTSIFKKIPFLESSYFASEEFSISKSETSSPQQRG